MKLNFFAIGLFPFSCALALLAPQSASAVCVGLDIPTQIAIHGVDDQATQYSESQFEAEPGCSDAVTVNSGTQVYTGYGDIHQEQVNHHQLGGGTSAGYYPAVDPVFVSVPTQVNLDVLPDDSYWNDYGSGGYDGAYSYGQY